jgi:hypothetical protein
MNPLLEKLAQSGLTEEQALRAQQRAEHFLKAASEDWGLKKEFLEKMGFAPWEAIKGVGQTAGRMVVPALGQSLAYAGAGALLGGGAFAARKGYEAVESRLGKAKAYNEMVEARPELKDRDPKAVQRAFDSLYRFNPSYAKDPLVAGSFVDSVAASERLDLGTVNALVTARKGMEGAPFDPSKYVKDVRLPDPADVEMARAKEERAAAEHPLKMDQYRQQAAERAEQMKFRTAEHPEKMDQYRRQAEEHGEKVKEYGQKSEKHEWGRPKEPHVDPMTAMYTGGRSSIT